MNTYLRTLICAVLISTVAFPAQADTLRVVAYNALNVSGSSIVDRRDDFRAVFESIDADVVLLQEVINQDAVDQMLSFALLPVQNDWVALEFHNGPDTDNACFYRSSKVAFISQRAISTTLRDINEYILRPHSMDSSETVRFYSAHLKASTGSSNEERRRQEAQTLRGQLDLLPENSLFMFVGDFNLYTSAEPAYQLLLDAAPNPNGQLFDPINRPGSWHNSVSFADIHTQSPRVNGNGGAGGGMDDRFDFILVSAGLNDGSGSHVLPATYTAWGNDGFHFNQAINSGTNHAVSAEVADALHDASDHLPVVADFVFVSEISDAAPEFIAETDYQLLKCYPNPFNSSLTIEVTSLSSPAVLTVYDLMGRNVHEREINTLNTSASRQVIDFSEWGNGIYFVSIVSDNAAQTQKVLYLK